MRHDPSVVGSSSSVVSRGIKKKSKASRLPKTFICGTCSRAFSTKGNLDFHISSIHLRSVSFGCDLCPKIFAQAGNLKTHKNNVHGINNKKASALICSICNKLAFKTKEDLQRHILNHQHQVHSQETSSHLPQLHPTHIIAHAMQQPQQQQTFHPPAQIEIVQNPLLLDTSSLQHIVTASHATSQAHHLQQQQHAHLMGKPKRKNFIPLQTISETDLIRQGVQVIQTPPTQVTVTALDGTPGGTPVDLGGLYHHTGLMATSSKIAGGAAAAAAAAALNKKKKHACTLCDKAFAQIINLRTHVATVHEGKKNYPCPECDKNFTQKGNLKAHITTIHQKLKNFQCVYCHKLFSQKGNMKTHIKNTHS